MVMYPRSWGAAVSVDAPLAGEEQVSISRLVLMTYWGSSL